MLPPPPVATGLDWSIDIAGTTVGTRPSTGFSYVLGSDPNSMKVIERNRTAGMSTERSLRVKRSDP